MNKRTAKELLHIRDWLETAERLTEKGRAAYDSDPLLQEAGDSLMMKIGEAARRLEQTGQASAEIRWRDAVANRNWLIHQYDHIDRDITWATLTSSLPAWGELLAAHFAEALATLAGEAPK